jgi:hypothetical protein
MANREQVIECEWCNRPATTFSIVRVTSEEVLYNHFAECGECYEPPTLKERETTLTKEEYLTWLIESKL